MGATLAELKARILDIADHTNSSRVDTDRLTDYINAMGREMNNLVLSANEQHLMEEQEVTVVAGTESYALESDLKHIYAVWYMEGDDRFKLKRADMQEFDHYDVTSGAIVYPWRDMRYRLIGQKIYFLPKPDSAATVVVWYQPGFTPLSISVDVPDFWPDGAEDFIVYGAAAMVLSRDKTQSSFWKKEKEQIRQDIKDQLEDRDRHEPHKIIDTQYGGHRHSNFPWASR